MMGELAPRTYQHFGMAFQIVLQATYPAFLGLNLISEDSALTAYVQEKKGVAHVREAWRVTAVRHGWSRLNGSATPP
jgi:hypothetical protein